MAFIVQISNDDVASVVQIYSSILCFHLIDISARLILASKPQPIGITVTIHSGLADGGLWPAKNEKGQVKGQNSIQLWYLLRALDKDGNGSAVVRLSDIAKILRISIYSVRRYIKSAFALGLLRGDKVRWEANRHRIFYSSLADICARFNIADIGGCRDIDISEIRNIKFIAAEAEALRLQNQSLYKEKHRKKRDQFKKVLTPEELTTSELCNGAILFRRGRLTFLKRSVSSYGGTQKRIAYELGRHPSTVQRRLSDGYRHRHNLDPIAKTQLAVAPQTINQWIDGQATPIKKLAPGQNIIVIPGWGKFRIVNNVYSLPIELLPKRPARQKVKRLIKRNADREAFSNDWKLDPRYQAMRAAEYAIFNQDSLSLKSSLPPGKRGGEP